MYFWNRKFFVSCEFTYRRTLVKKKIENRELHKVVELESNVLNTSF